MGRLWFYLTAAALAVVVLFACSDDPVTAVGPATDAGNIEAGADPTPGDPPPGDVMPPGKVTDLAGTAESHNVVKLTWTAPTDETGRAAAYELKLAKTPIIDETSFATATFALPPTPAPQGTAETVLVLTLDPDTEYHFVIRGRDAAGNKAPISNEAVVKTKPRASFLISEIALTNTAAQGSDFVELIVTKAGGADGIEIKQASGSLYKLAAIDLAVGDRVVVHLTGVPGPAGFAQEDVSKSKTASTAEIPAAGTTPAIPVHSVDAYDVYSTETGITGSDNLVQVLDGAVTVDAIAFSNRDGDAATSTMTAFAKAKTDSAWKFTDAPVDGTNDCATQRDAVNVATAENACGGFDADMTPSALLSLNRNALTDTNTKADFYVAAQTPGAANAAVAAPKLLSAIATSATAVDIRFDQEIAPATVVLASFTLAPTLSVTAATLSAPNRVTLTTLTQMDPAYVATLAATVTNTHGVAPTPLTARFCAFTATAAVLALSEVNANITGSADLVELEVKQGGALAGYQVRANPTATSSGNAVATLPGICAATGDFIVIHLTPAAAPATSETTAKNENPTATYAFNYDAAWDVRGSGTGIVMANTILAVRTPAGAWIDAAAFSDGTNPASATSLGSLAFIQSQAFWTPADCGGVACGNATIPTAQSICAQWGTLGTDASTSIRRTGVTKDKDAWTVGASTFGAN